MTYVKDDADDTRTCTCGTVIKAGTLQIRDLITRHLRNSHTKHVGLANDKESRTRETLQVLGQNYKTLKKSMDEAQKGEVSFVPETGTATVVPATIPATSEDAVTLMTSVKVVGEKSSLWQTDQIFGYHIP